MTKGLDHLVLCVKDLSAARQTYEQLGFTVTPDAHHPFGTANCLVQLDGVFLEILAVEDAGKFPPVNPYEFSFARFNNNYLTVREGFSMLVLESKDATSDHETAKRDGLSPWPVFNFSRGAKLPDGREETVSFALNFVTHRDMPMAAFFTCQQYVPQFFWQPQYQTHANSAHTIKEVCLVATEPDRYTQFLENFSHGIAEYENEDDVLINTRRGAMRIATPAVYEDNYQLKAPETVHGPMFGGFKVGVDDISRVSTRKLDCFGVGIVFEQSE